MTELEIQQDLAFESLLTASCALDDWLKVHPDEEQLAEASFFLEHGRRALVRSIPDLYPSVDCLERAIEQLASLRQLQVPGTPLHAQLGVVRELCRDALGPLRG
jgi:hypothetical protein